MVQQNITPEIRIDKEGVWFFRGVEMKRQEIVMYFYQHLKIDSNGCYLIEIEDDYCHVTVEDAPFVVKSIDVFCSRGNGQPYIELSLSDGSSEELNNDAPLWISDDNVMYCKVKNGKYAARFSRSAYYQLCEYAEYDIERAQYFITLTDRSYPIELHHATKNGGPNVR